VTAIGDLIYYQYAKIIAKSAFAAPDGSRGQGKALRVREADVRGIGKGSQELWGDLGGEKFSNFLGASPLPSPLLQESRQ